MPGRVEGKVAFITGAARGQGRSHAVRLAEEGADIIAVDICQRLPDGPATRMATADDLAETVKLVEALDRRIVAAPGRRPRPRRAQGGRRRRGRRARPDRRRLRQRRHLHASRRGTRSRPQIWQDMIDINLTGVWNTMVAAVPHLIASGRRVDHPTSSTAGIKGFPNLAPYAAAKHGVVGIARTWPTSWPGT